MAKGHFVLNGKGYIAKRHPRTNKLISRRSTDPFPETQRPEGQQRRTQVKTRSSILFQDFFEGFTHRRSTAEGLTAVHGFFDSLCDTRWGDVYPSILAQDSTETGLEQIRASAVFKGELWAIWQDADSQDLLSRNFTGSTATWENGGTIESNAANVELVGLDLIAHKDRLVVLYAEARRYTAEHSTDGVTWTIAVSGLGPSGQLLSDDITDDEDIDGGLLAEIENELIAVLWDEVNSSITFFSDFSSGVSWDDEAVDIYSANGPQGVAVRRGEDGELKLIVATHEGLWEVDVAPATWTLRKIWDMPGHNDNGRRMAIGPDGAVWFAQGVTDDEAAPILRLFVEDAEWKVEPVPGSLHLNDTVPSDMLGSIKWWKRSQDFMYASLGGGTVGGSSSLKARIICHAGGGFHHMYQAGTADQPIQWMDVASEDDGTQRLHFAIRTAAGTSDTQFLARPNSSPVNDSNRIYIDNAHLDLPDVNGGMPTTSATWIKVGVDATDLDTLEFIDVTHGLNGAVRTTTDLGNITASIRQDPPLGSSSKACTRACTAAFSALKSSLSALSATGSVTIRQSVLFHRNMRPVSTSVKEDASSRKCMLDVGLSSVDLPRKCTTFIGPVVTETCSNCVVIILLPLSRG